MNFIFEQFLLITKFVFLTALPRRQNRSHSGLLLEIGTSKERSKIKDIAQQKYGEVVSATRRLLAALANLFN